jgi:chromosomal replication initiation ATPase DnaA
MKQIELINKEVSAVFGISVKDIEGKSRQQERVFARFASIYIAKNLFDFNVTNIGRHFDRHYSSIINALEKSSYLIDQDWVFTDNLSKSWYNVQRKL